jgi:hypothetical protein
MVRTVFDVNQPVLDAIEDLRKGFGVKNSGDALLRAVQLAKFAIDNADDGALKISTKAGEKTIMLTK